TQTPAKTHKVGADILYAASAIPSQTSMDKLRAAHSKRKVPVARVYKGMDWAALSDDEAFPTLRMAVRGGSSKVAGHGMLDLLSIRCRVNGELMITDQQDGAYMASTFTKRGNDLYGRSAASKSTLFIDGLGCMADATCDSTEVVKGTDWLGIRIDASHIYIPRWKNVFVGRLVMLVDKAYWLVVDRIQGKDVEDKHWIESRYHTLAANKPGKNSVALKSGQERMQISFAALQPAALQQSFGMPSQPGMKQTRIYRWMSSVASADHLHVTALVPGARKATIEIRRTKADGFVIAVTEPTGKTRRIKLTADLQPAR
ncbi:MAG: heparinase II/III family protein, partial [Kiritimatiellia bacterium]